MVQLSRLYMTTGKTIAFDYMDLCRQSDATREAPIYGVLINMINIISPVACRLGERQ